MKTADQISKIKAVILFILEQMPKGLDYIHLFKIMYFAQQDHLVRYGLPLCEDTFVARKHGPVPTFTYKALHCLEGKIDDPTPELSEFNQSLSLEQINGTKVVMCAMGASCDKEELSKSNISILDKWIAKCKDIAAFDLSDLSHDQAWQIAYKATEITGEDTRISQYSMAKAGGATQAMLDVIRERQNNRRMLAWT